MFFLVSSGAEGAPFSASLLTYNVVKRPLLFSSWGSGFSASLFSHNVVKRPLFFSGWGNGFSSFFPCPASPRRVSLMFRLMTARSSPPNTIFNKYLRNTTNIEDSSRHFPSVSAQCPADRQPSRLVVQQRIPCLIRLFMLFRLLDFAYQTFKLLSPL